MGCAADLVDLGRAWIRWMRQQHVLAHSLNLICLACASGCGRGRRYTRPTLFCLVPKTETHTTNPRGRKHAEGVFFQQTSIYLCCLSVVLKGNQSILPVSLPRPSRHIYKTCLRTTSVLVFSLFLSPHRLSHRACVHLFRRVDSPKPPVPSTSYPGSPPPSSSSFPWSPSPSSP